MKIYPFTAAEKNCRKWHLDDSAECLKLFYGLGIGAAASIATFIFIL